MKNATLTKIVELTMFGLKSYRWECECGESSKGYDREADALKSAKKHGAQAHG
jgi:tRNA U55 pseudouridine synthase TruB